MEVPPGRIRREPLAVKFSAMSTYPENGPKDGPELGRAGQERLESTIAPPQLGSDFTVDPTVLTSIRQRNNLLGYTKMIDQGFRFSHSRHRDRCSFQLWHVALGPYSKACLPFTHRRTGQLLSQGEEALKSLIWYN